MISNNEDYAVLLENVSMHFNMSAERLSSLKEYFIKFAKHQLFFKRFVALDCVNVEIKKGDVYGIVGLNGSGKSTLLKLISGILKPTFGKIVVNGRISPLIELGAGFNMELTARENIYLNGAVLGYSKRFMHEKFDEIVEFSQMADFLDIPMKNYSSGMVARVAFAVATVVKPDILIVDEILSVGDFKFQEKCNNRIKEMMQGNTTVILVSHQIEEVEKICNRVLWLEKGSVKMIGNVKDVCSAYKTS